MHILARSVLVGVSRRYLGVRDPGDVMVGWVLAALGVGVGLAASGGVRRPERLAGGRARSGGSVPGIRPGAARS